MKNPFSGPNALPPQQQQVKIIPKPIAVALNVPMQPVKIVRPVLNGRNPIGIHGIKPF